MSNPSFSNIDLWLFELAEGNLSQAQIEQLELFLLQNPDLDVDRDIWEMSKVNAAPVVYPDQAGLSRKKSSRPFVLVGSSALLLLSLVGCLTFVDSNKIKVSVEDSAIASIDLRNNKEDQLLSEIQELKSTVTSLEQKVAKSISEKEALIASINQTGSSSANMVNGNVSFGTSSNTHSSSLEPGANAMMTSSAGVLPTSNQNNVAGNLEETSFLSGESKQLEVKETQYIPTSYDNLARTVSKASSSWSGRTNGGYNNSLKNKMSRFARNIQRMMDNPVALKNSRDPHFHIPGKAVQDLNFGSTGTLITPRVQTLSRLQWFGQENEQLMNQLSVDGYSYSMRGGVGLQLNHSMYNRGGIQVANVALTYSPKISVNRRISIEPAFRFKMGNKLLDDNNMTDVTQVEFDRGNVHDYYNDGTQPIGKSLWYKDLGAGVNVNTEWFFVSAQVDNIFNHTDNIYSTDLTNPRRAGTQFVATIGTDWENKDKTYGAAPYLLYQNNEQLSEAWLGANFHYRWFTMGGAVSSNLEPAASIGIKMDRFSLQYNADYTYSLMNDKKALSHQLTLRFLGKPSRFGKRLLNL